MKNIKWLKEISLTDIETVGGKNASLGEMYNNLRKEGIQIPNAFVLTTNAFENFLEDNNLKDDIDKLISYSIEISMKTSENYDKYIYDINLR